MDCGSSRCPCRLIYLEEERSFGGSLDDGRKRMEYYHQVLDRAIRREPKAKQSPVFTNRATSDARDGAA